MLCGGVCAGVREEGHERMIQGFSCISSIWCDEVYSIEGPFLTGNSSSICLTAIQQISTKWLLERPYNVVAKKEPSVVHPCNGILFGHKKD